MAAANRAVIVIGALVGAIATVGLAFIFGKFGTPILLASPRTGFAMAVFLVLLGSSLRRMMARKRRVVAAR